MGRARGVRLGGTRREMPLEGNDWGTGGSVMAGNLRPCAKPRKICATRHGPQGPSQRDKANGTLPALADAETSFSRPTRAQTDHSPRESSDELSRWGRLCRRYGMCCPDRDRCRRSALSRWHGTDAKHPPQAVTLVSGSTRAPGGMCSLMRSNMACLRKGLVK